MSYFAFVLCFIAFYLFLKGIKALQRKGWGKVDQSNEINVSGKVIIITGASAGIGKETAEELAARGAKVIMACRNKEKTEQVIRDIRSRTKNGELIYMGLDLTSLESVRSFCKEFKKSHDSLHILINNAGSMNPAGVKRFTKDGLEETIGVNHIAHFLLTNLLLEELRRSGSFEDPSRIINVSSAAHIWGEINTDDLFYEKSTPKDVLFISKFYCDSKMANVLFTLELAKRFRAAGDNVRSYTLCPGFVATDLGKDDVKSKFILNIVFPIMRMILKNPKEGAATTLHCALSKNLTHHSGEMYRNCEYWDPSKRPKLNEEVAAKLWKLSEKLAQL